MFRTALAAASCCLDCRRSRNVVCSNTESDDDSYRALRIRTVGKDLFELATLRKTRQLNRLAGRPLCDFFMGSLWFLYESGDKLKSRCNGAECTAEAKGTIKELVVPSLRFEKL